jgi:hypothetical protein
MITDGLSPLTVAGHENPSCTARRRSLWERDMTRPVRIMAVTVGLTLAGAVLGGVAGAVALAIALAVTEGPAAAADAGVLAFAAYLGAVLGAVSGPVVAWLLLRHVPLGRVFLGSVAGTVVGGVAGWISTTAFDQIQYAVLGALAGFFTAVVALRRRIRASVDATAVPGAWATRFPHHAHHPSRRLY